MKRIGVLGSTGSIGTQTLDVVSLFAQPDCQPSEIRKRKAID